MKDYTETAKRIALGDVVLGTWDNPAGSIYIKGRAMDAIEATMSRDPDYIPLLDVIDCDDAAEADLLRQRFGDGLN